MRDDDDVKITEYTPRGRLGFDEGHGQGPAEGGARPGNARYAASPEQAGRRDVRQLRLGQPAKPHIAEFCENGAKATAWELSSLRVTPDFFAKHTVTELEAWPDHDLEQAGRLTHPMRYDRASDKYVAVSWDEAFAAIGAKLKSCDPTKVVLYASGRASLETSFMYSLFARMWGQQNLPDSSNMCHETTSVGLKSAIGSPVATIQMEDYDKCDAIFSFGQNVATNAPRMLHNLQACAKRGWRS